MDNQEIDELIGEFCETYDDFMIKHCVGELCYAYEKNLERLFEFLEQNGNPLSESQQKSLSKQFEDRKVAFQDYILLLGDRMPIIILDAINNVR